MFESERRGLGSGPLRRELKGRPTLEVAAGSPEEEDEGVLGVEAVGPAERAAGLLNKEERENF